MRVLLRRTDTGLFFQGPDKWTSKPGRAHDFIFIDRALRFAVGWGLREVEVAFAFNNPLYIRTAPLERLTADFQEAPAMLMPAGESRNYQQA
jgi:hypothetical protein